MAIEYQVLKEFGYKRSKRDWTKGGWRVGSFAIFVYGDNGGRFPAGGKGVRRPGPVEDGEKMLLS